MRKGSVPGQFTTIQPIAAGAPSAAKAHLVFLVDFTPTEGLPFVLCTCGARVEAAVDRMSGRDPYAGLLVQFSTHRRTVGLMTTSGGHPRAFEEAAS